MEQKGLDGLNQLFWFTHSSMILLIPLPYPFPVKEAIICGIDNLSDLRQSSSRLLQHSWQY